MQVSHWLFDLWMGFCSLLFPEAENSSVCHQIMWFLMLALIFGFRVINFMGLSRGDMKSKNVLKCPLLNCLHFLQRFGCCFHYIFLIHVSWCYSAAFTHSQLCEVPTWIQNRPALHASRLFPAPLMLFVNALKNSHLKNHLWVFFFVVLDKLILSILIFVQRSLKFFCFYDLRFLVLWLLLLLYF